MSKERPAVCYYVSGHGLGHATRAAQVMRCIPVKHPLIVKTCAPEAFLRREVKRSFDYKSVLDLGTWQDSNFAVNWERTFRDAQKIQGAAEKAMEDEVRFLREHKVSAVVCDVPPMPLAAAREAGIPGIASVNFTWVEIYEPKAKGDPARERLIEKMRRQYSTATLALRTPMSFPMSYFPEVRDVPLIARHGRARRNHIVRELGIPKTDRLVLVYLESWSSSQLPLERIVGISGVTFLGFPPLQAPVRVLNPERWDFADVVASVDAVLAKPGYGTLGECMANGTPVVYYPRPEFAEYKVLSRAVDEWGGAVRMSTADMHACRWQNALDAACALKPQPVDSSGARETARAIAAMV